MIRAFLGIFLFVAILGLGCMGVVVPGKADELKHPIELGANCKILRCLPFKVPQLCVFVMKDCCDSADRLRN
jgi:hypothetical protein